MPARIKIRLTLITTVILALIGIFCYGVYSKAKQTSVIGTYTSNTISKPDSTLEYVERAHKYNENIRTLHDNLADLNTVNSIEDYHSIFPENNGMIGIVRIKKIDLSLPIYHGTEEEQLMKGIGHVEDTAFPLDTPGTRSVLTGHNGVMGADMLFTRLDEMVKGDEFTIQIGTYAYVYKINEMTVLTPEETEVYAHKQIEPNKTAEVTLVTCTPYGINSHRLLLIGEFQRKEIIPVEAIKENKVQIVSFGKETIAIGIIVMLGLTSIVVTLVRNEKE